MTKPKPDRNADRIHRNAIGTVAATVDFAEPSPGSLR